MRLANKIKYAIREKIPPHKRYFWFLLKRKIFGYGNKTYAQYGEDLILREIFQCRTEGFYVDIGAFHPKLISNTYFFYKLGWNGINIDATPGSMNLFKRMRKKDINLECAVSDITTELTFYTYDSPSLNTFSPELVKKRIQEGQSHPKLEKTITTSSLAKILDKNVPEGKKINILSIDVEGMDLKVLQSNNWGKYVPQTIITEKQDGFNPLSPADDSIVAFLKKKDYSLFAITPGNLLFAKNK
jgi:FkbM family methyltransferase